MIPGPYPVPIRAAEPADGTWIMVVKPTFQSASKESCRRFKACWGTETECGRLWARLIGTEAVVALGSHRIVAASTGAPSIRMGTWLASIGCEKVMASVP